MDDIVFGESPRWHDGRLWFSDWGAGRVFSVADGTAPRSRPRSPSFPMCIDFLPDGRLLRGLGRDAAAAAARARRFAGPACRPVAGLDKPLERHRRGRPRQRLCQQHRLRLPRRGFAPGLVVLVTPDGRCATVADGLAFPNGMAITPDGATLIVAESYAEQLTAYDIAADGDPRRPAGVGRDARRPPGRDLPRCRGRRSGTPTSATSTACGSARAARCSPRSTSTGARSPARCRGRSPRCRAPCCPREA